LWSNGGEHRELSALTVVVWGGHNTVRGKKGEKEKNGKGNQKGGDDQILGEELGGGIKSSRNKEDQTVQLLIKKVTLLEWKERHQSKRKKETGSKGDPTMP